ncbi:HNH endonuclease [Vibrio parahaemolyticus]|uniref:HNH endonuclease signature motif containing protein n=1 Tax=Vibrio parahaemolyticus TaxID=670 RepID=UPI00111F286F|nr:HNH endonuclease signature motif containing protein [Vibrio parahaemolyticus]EIO4562716.1 HNH endonuclease [Vibrio parahaemolyticus]EIO4614689.1 HNH endonuclease [Vibrio parahaemolyticus]ELA7847830.1 HNH endonuclease [Vibrio parahaemolyticus]ELA9311732.1 HNH endonuclease [Vibrio parahaemolyticus]TOI17623.1 HNH endonuclease [Vibrio parahaemolyticus]
MIKLERGPCPYPKALENKNYKHPNNKEALKKASFDKCMYCESKISHIDHAHVEHIKPKAEGKFPALAYVWENLGYACPKCNGAKSDKYFSLSPFINPYEDEPSEYIFCAGAILCPKKGSERAEVTINQIELNRPDLLEKRMNKINEIQKSLDACYRVKDPELRALMIQELKLSTAQDKEYSYIVKYFLKAHEIDVT